jgi:Cytidylate kinase-like family
MHSAPSTAVVADTLQKVYAHWEQRSKARAVLFEEPRFHGYTIALARQTATQSSLVAQEVGRRLNWPVYDHELLERIARDMGLRADLIENMDERVVNHLRQFTKEFMAGFASGPIADETSYVRHLTEALVTLGMLGECVIVGRGAAQVLPSDSTLRVRLVAPHATRIANLRRHSHLSHADAEQRIDSIDRERRAFVKEYFHKDPADPANFDLVLNVARFSPAQCADLIIAALARLQQER